MTVDALSSASIVNCTKSLLGLEFSMSFSENAKAFKFPSVSSERLDPFFFDRLNGFVKPFLFSVHEVRVELKKLLDGRVVHAPSSFFFSAVTFFD